MQCLGQSCIWQNCNKAFGPSLARLGSCSETCIRPVGKCELPCWVRAERYQVCFQVFDWNYMPLLGRSSCKNMGLIQGINAIESGSILDEFPEVFQGLGCLPGKYHISVDSSVPPVVRPPRGVPHSKRDPLKKELDRMEDVGIIETDLFVYGWIQKTLMLPLKKENYQEPHCFQLWMQKRHSAKSGKTRRAAKTWHLISSLEGIDTWGCRWGLRLVQRFTNKEWSKSLKDRQGCFSAYQRWQSQIEEVKVPYTAGRGEVPWPCVRPWRFEDRHRKRQSHSFLYIISVLC